jgi:SRSO17 transposase
MWDEVMARVAGRFTRVEPRRTARAFLAGLLSGIQRKNCWWLAERAGHQGPQRMQRLLRDAVWDSDQVRDDVRDLVVQALGRPDGVLIPDETGFLKKGVHSVAVQRQYTGTAGRIENSQVAVFLAYASNAGRALIDRRIYLPASWTEDQPRCEAACRPGGSLPTRSTATTPPSAPESKPSAWATSWPPWHRFITLAMLALAFLSILADTAARQHDPDPHRYAHHNDPIALTTSEIRHLIDTLVITNCRNPRHLLHWSIWRRRHQATARRAHYRRRLTAEFRT